MLEQLISLCSLLFIGRQKILICRYFLFIIYNSSVAGNQSLFFVHCCQCSQGGRMCSEFGALLSQINQLNSLSIANRIYGTRTITFHKVSIPGASEFHSVKMGETEKNLRWVLFTMLTLSIGILRNGFIKI